MSSDPEIGARALRARLDHDEGSCVVVDCRFDLADTEAGRRAWAEATIPGAVYAHLDEDLSGPIEPGRSGRHPFPEPTVMQDRLRRWGVGLGTSVVAFDDKSGPFAARLWWLLRWLGHEDVRVLIGGVAAWQSAGGRLAPGNGGTATRVGSFEARPRPELLATTAEVEALVDSGGATLVDARTPLRFTGEQEPIDAEGGHIRGAINLPWPQNLDGPPGQGGLRDAEALRARFGPHLRAGEPVVVYCGSGVTACHDLLAMARAGIEGGRLYVGSWSEWIVDPDHPRASGSRSSAGHDR